MYYLHLWPTIAFPCSCEQIYKYVVCNLGKMQVPNLPLFFTDPELMENAQASKDTSTEPTTITALNGVSRSMDFSLRIYKIRSTGFYLVRHTYMGKGSRKFS